MAVVALAWQGDFRIVGVAATGDPNEAYLCVVGNGITEPDWRTLTGAYLDTSKNTGVPNVLDVALQAYRDGSVVQLLIDDIRGAIQGVAL